MAKAKKLPSGSWRVQASKVVDGKLIRKSFSSPYKKEAETKAAEWLSEVENGAVCESITLDAAYDKYIELKNSVLSPSTIKAYKSMHQNTFAALMEKQLEAIRATDIQREVNLLSANHTPKYVRNAYGLLSAVLSMFRPAFHPNITLPQKQKTDLYIPDDKEIKTLLQAAQGTSLEIPILLAAFGPMRRGEICALTSDDIHGNIVTVNKALVQGDDKKWQIKPPKTFSSYRNIEYPPFVIDKIKGIQGKIVTISPTAITKFFPMLLEKCGLPNFRFHDLRHYAVSTLHAINIPDKYIMARGGWATNHTMNNVYNHVLKSKADQTEKQITKHFSSVFKST